MTDQTPQPSKSFTDSPWFLLIMGIVAIVGVFYLNTMFMELETGAVESVRIHWMFALMYNTCGRVPTVLFGGGVGLFMIGFGIYRFFTEQS